ncbi:helix-turn-helix domain-containing protein [Chryseobacterium sp. Leaf201]|uniref:helix-turn-helix domain-containing protein n=1 Tax=Chryseobacterium sp. Leaf201 TaxID=1735672 RepID=UPI0006FBF9ED|nr:helix-turn-helix transcriptional regulator [Chryseobacterium sp. Leaf201]KQM21755.1 hypothetical protein ASE55_18230 [Chryseobacterium sp. Leaf201]
MQQRKFENILQQIGIVILLYRLRNNFSQFSLGVEVQLSTNQIGRIERGETNPTVLTLTKLASALNVDILEFFVKRSKSDMDMIIIEIKELQEKISKK